MERGRVLVTGAINTDLVARVQRAPGAGETITGQSFQIFGGGKGANQALACARSGAATHMLGAVGNDDFGRQRLADLQEDGIDVDGVVLASEAASGVALIVVEASGENRIAYVPGATSTITPDDALAVFRRTQPAIVLSTIELPNPSLDALFSEARASGGRVIVNATPEPETGRNLLPLADVLIVNETEAIELLDHATEGDWTDVTSRLRDLGPSTVIVTLGGEGALANIAGEIVRVPAPRVAVVDTTGAGDAFCGAFAASLAQGAGERDAIRAGVAAGSLAVTMEGAQRSMPRRPEIERVMDDIGAI